ncbi:MAG: hypothetical protein Q7J35_18290 [Candidatus Methanoperedens sp.]|nr:hypothetical protein [Candidatus Methanoperedens sp.]
MEEKNQIEMGLKENKEGTPRQYEDVNKNTMLSSSIESRRQGTQRSLTLKILVGILALEFLFSLSQFIWVGVIFKSVIGYFIWNKKIWAAYAVAVIMVPLTFMNGMDLVLHDETLFEGLGSIFEAIILLVLITYNWKEYSN